MTPRESVGEQQHSSVIINTESNIDDDDVDEAIAESRRNSNKNNAYQHKAEALDVSDEVMAFWLKCDSNLLQINTRKPLAIFKSTLRTPSFYQLFNTYLNTQHRLTVINNMWEEASEIRLLKRTTKINNILIIHFFK